MFSYYEGLWVRSVMTSFIEGLFSLEGKTAIITGASRGIGKELALSFKKAGANVVCISSSKCPADYFLKDNYKQCDITDSARFELLCKESLEKYGSLDILVNAAGITNPYNSGDDKHEIFDKSINVNLNATYKCSEIISRFMFNSGSIINITSIGSLLGFPGNPGYVAAKGGLRMLTKSLAIDFSSINIRVNNLVPGYISTDMTKKSRNNPVSYKERLERMIIQRWGEVNDLVGAAIFLASDASSYVTGTDLVVDGGWSAKGL